MKPVSLLLILLSSIVFSSLSSCGKKAKTETTDADQIEMVVESTDSSSTQTPVSDTFRKAVASFSKDFPQYTPQHTELIDTLSGYAEHWLFSIVERRRKQFQNSEEPYSKKALAKMPELADYQSIDLIRQGAFHLSGRSSNDVVFEEWTLNDAPSAERWLVLLRDSLRGNDYTKPPRFQWVEGAQLYLVNTRSAAQWFELSDSLVRRLTGKSKSQMNNLYDPLDLRRFKERLGLAHSSVLETELPLFTEKSGTHYSYFYFAKQRPLSQSSRRQGNFVHRSDFQIITSLHGPMTGTEKYESIMETPVAIQCAINEPELNKLDIVNKTIEEVEKIFGSAIYQKDDFKILGHSNRILVVKLDQEQVITFKYLRLSTPFEILKDKHEVINNYILNFD